jgi:hypothetical protein
MAPGFDSVDVFVVDSSQSPIDGLSRPIKIALKRHDRTSAMMILRPYRCVTIGHCVMPGRF